MITCAVTGGGEGNLKSPHVPITPEQIANDALKAARAGATAVHIHVRDPKTGKSSRKLELYREVFERIREVNTDVIINLTGGMGGELLFGPQDDLLKFQPEMDFVSPEERIEHIVALHPDVASFDVGSVNFGEALYATTSSWNEYIAGRYQEAGVLPELEVFELGHIEEAKALFRKGLLPATTVFQLCLGIGAPATPEGLLAMRSNLPADATWFAFGVGARQIPTAGLAVLLGGHVRVGLEDNLYLSRGVLATNEQLVERARNIIETLGCNVMSTQGAREHLGLAPAKVTA
jgi:uncharacterized protein (DUF849 family)